MANLNRQPKGKVAVYKKETRVAPNVYRAPGPVTIVPKDSDADQELKQDNDVMETYGARKPGWYPKETGDDNAQSS